MFVAGEWTDAQSGETFTAESPATGEAIGQVPQGNREDARAAIQSATRAADGWARSTAFEPCTVSPTRSSGAARASSTR